jgi:predicted RNA-binding Zn-ribbon protein involved in translation (DUF1610 family)
MSGGSESHGQVYAFDASRIPWQKEFIECTASEVMADGAFGSGKTRGLGEKVYMNLALYPGNRGLLARKTYSSIENTTLQTFLDEVVPDSHMVGRNKARHLVQVQSPLYPTAWCAACGWETTRTVAVEERGTVYDGCPECGAQAIRWTPASELYYEGLRTNGTRPGDMPEKIAGMDLGFVAVDEAIEITEKDWEMLQGRLRLVDLGSKYVRRLPYRQIFCATNPDTPDHWLFKRFIKRGVGVRISSSTEDNPYNPPDYLERLRRQFSGADFERYVQGEWTGRQGLVYSDYSEATHVLEPLSVPDLLGDGWTSSADRQARLREREAESGVQTGDPDARSEYLHHGLTPPPGTPVYLGVDWGYRPDPQVVQWWARTASHGWVLYRELFKTRQLSGDTGEEVVRRSARHELANVQAVYADHSSGDRREWLEGVRRGLEAEYAEEDRPRWHRLRTTAAEKARLDGVKHCMATLRPDESGRPGAHFIRGSRCHTPDRHLVQNDAPTCTLAEIRSYGWAGEAEEDPQDYHDHGMDSMRYTWYSHHVKGAGTSGDSTAVFKS